MRAFRGCLPLCLGSEVVDVAHQTAFQVGGFVFVDVATLRQAVNHADHFRQELDGLSLIFHLAQIFDSRASGFFIVTVLQATLGGLADAFECGTVMCHFIEWLSLRAAA